MKIKETRILTSDDLRRCCISNSWYTKGNSSEYANLFEMLSKGIEYVNITTEVLMNIAVDIKEHSETLEEIEDIMFEINRFTHTFFEREE